MLKSSKTMSLALIFSCLYLLSAADSFGQTVLQDYFTNRTGGYHPSDPWQKGRIFRTHTGHDGLYYNCDGEEEKRCSPWIRWPQRPCDDLFSLRRVHNERCQTIENAIERWRMGSCQDQCGGANGTGYPPGAGYGIEPIRSSRFRDLPDMAPADINMAPDDPVPAASRSTTVSPVVSGTRNGASESKESAPKIETPRYRVVNLPSTNHLKPVPKM